MSLRYKIFIIIITGQISLMTVLGIAFIRFTDHITDESRKQRVQELIFSFNKEISHKEKKLEKCLGGIPRNPVSKNLLTGGLKDRSIFTGNLLHFREIMQSCDLNILELGDPSGKVYFRFHRPADFGDDKGKQKIIQDALNGIVSSSIEIGHSGLGLRTAGPFGKNTILLGQVIDNNFASQIVLSEGVYFAIFEKERLLAYSDPLIKEFVTQKNPEMENKKALFQERTFYSLKIPYKSDALLPVPVSFFMMVDETKLNSELSGISNNFLIIAVIVLAITLFASLLFSEKIIRAVKNLSISMKEFHDDRPGFLKTDRSDEIGDIARSFVIMKSELVNYHNHLEEMVEEKTKEVVRRIEEKEYINDTFGKIVDPSVRDYLLHKNDLLGGELVEATILFADIRGFTSLSERMTPKEIVLLLNRYFESVSKCIYEEKGIINKYIGDAIMAVFGVLVPVENHAKAAFESALKMKSEVQILNRKLREENFPEIRTGIGIHSGLVLAGNIGSSKRMEYTVIGDTVNIASRMESLSKYYNREIIISETTKNFLGPDYEISFLNNVKLKGREEKTNIYCPKEQVPLSIYTTGIDLNPFASG